jgi:hypothetical protein
MCGLKPLKRLTLNFPGVYYFGDQDLQSHYVSPEAIRTEGNPEQPANFLQIKKAPRLEQLALSGVNIEEEYVEYGFPHLLVCAYSATSSIS